MAHRRLLGAQVAVGVDLHLEAAVAEDAFGDDGDEVDAVVPRGDDEGRRLVVRIRGAGADAGDEDRRVGVWIVERARRPTRPSRRGLPLDEIDTGPGDEVPACRAASACRRRCRSDRTRRPCPRLIWQSTGHASQRTLSAAMLLGRARVVEDDRLAVGAQPANAGSRWRERMGVRVGALAHPHPSPLPPAGEGEDRIAARKPARRHRHLAQAHAGRVHGSRSGSPAPSPPAPARRHAFRAPRPERLGVLDQVHDVIGGTSPTVGIR